MRTLAALVLTFSMVGCGGGALEQRLPDGAACVSDGQCGGTANVRAVAPGVPVTAVDGTCFVGSCCTQYDSPGWRCVVCNGEPTCWATPAPTPPPAAPADMARLDFDALPHCTAQLLDGGGQGPMMCDGGTPGSGA
jgi:hypothetical protein